MAIRIAAGEGVPIFEGLPPDPEDTNLEFAVTGKPLGVPYFFQIEGELCWAACAQMVFHFYGFTSVSQCKLVDLFLGPESHCCGVPVDVFHTHCNAGCRKPDIEAIYKAGNGPKLKVKQLDGPLTFQQLDTEINKHHRPVEVAIEWQNSNRKGGHVVIVQGCGRGPNNEKILFVNDPLKEYGQGQVRYEDLKSGYHTDGVWVSSWIEIAKP